MTNTQTLIALRAKYGKPTFRAYDDPAAQWNEWKAQAAELPLIEVKRHGDVSKDNQHSCRECFCCAAMDLFQEVMER